MATVPLRYVQRFVDRNGHVRHYFRRRGFKPAPLPGEPWSPEFMKAYWRLMESPEPVERAPKAYAGTIAALIPLYYKSSGFLTLSPSTRTARRNVLERFREEYGDDAVADLAPAHVRGILSKRTETPHAANNLLKILRSLLGYAVELEWIEANPCDGVRGLRAPKQGHHSWTDGEIEQFEKTWPIGTRERLAMALLLYTMQRRGDVVRMGRQHRRGGWIHIRQQKTGMEVDIPIHPNLDAVLSEPPTGEMTFLMTVYGKPFTAAGFGNWFRDVCTAAGLPHCSAHGLRKAGLTKAAERGATDHELMALGGHQSLSEVQRYTKAARRRMLARSGMDKLIGTASEHPSVNPRDRVDNSGEKAS